MKSFPDIRKYLNIPYKDFGRDYDGIDCYGLFLLIYKEELGIILPDYMFDKSCMEDASDWYVEDYPKFFKAIGKGDKMQAFDALMFRHKGMDTHVGIAINDAEFLHVSSRRVRKDSIRNEILQRKLVDIYRYYH